MDLVLIGSRHPGGAARVVGLRRLDEHDQARILHHWLALSPDDRRRLCQGLQSDAGSERHAATLDFSRTIAVGATTHDDAALLGLAAAVLDHPERPAIAEVTVSLLEEARGYGLARDLVGRVIDEAFARGAHTCRFDVRPDDPASLRLLRALGARDGSTALANPWQRRSAPSGSPGSAPPARHAPATQKAVPLCEPASA